MRVERRQLDGQKIKKCRRENDRLAIRDIALSIKRWALNNQMIENYPVRPEVDQGIIRSVFGTIGVPTATSILQHRGISYIGVAEQQNTIIIFTKRKLTVGEYKILANLSSISVNNQRTRIEFVHGGLASVGPNPPPPSVPPYAQHNDRYTCGSSVYIGSEKGAGTLGCLVRDEAGVFYGLSNNHVTGGSNYAVPGLPVVAPGMADVAAGSRDPETLGHHKKAYPFIDGLPDVVDAAGNLDAAIFAIQDADRLSSMQRTHYDTPASSASIAVGMHVQKVGRTSGLTTGTVIAELFDYEPVGYALDIIRGHEVVWFQSLFAIRATAGTFSSPGDSGSLIVTTDPNGNKVAVGIVVAGNDEGTTFALDIERILIYFDVTLVSGHNI